MEKSSAPSLLERNQFETLFRSEVMSLFKNKPTTILFLCINEIFFFVYSKNGGITSDGNTVSNWFRSNEDGAGLFSGIVH